MTIAEKRNAGLHKNKIGHILWCILRALLFIVTPIVIYAILQKKFTESLMSTSIVG